MNEILGAIVGFIAWELAVKAWDTLKDWRWRHDSTVDSVAPTPSRNTSRLKSEYKITEPAPWMKEECI